MDLRANFDDLASAVAGGNAGRRARSEVVSAREHQITVIERDGSYGNAYLVGARCAGFHFRALQAGDIGAGAAVRLTRLELRLLQMLLANAGHAVSSERLLVQVWGNRSGGDRQLLKQLVHRLRQKIEADPAAPALLRTAAAGYKLVVD